MGKSALREGGPPRLLDDAYAACRALAAAHGRSYYLAATLLPPRQQRSVHALYGFARLVDDIVDDTELGAQAKLARVCEVEAHLSQALDGAGADSLVLAALADTVRRHAIDPALLRAFLDSMRMDIPGTPGHRDRYRTMAELRGYMYGSAAVIGLQLLPVLGTVVPFEEAAPGAAALGEAFQLTNFLRDVAEDHHRGRVYLPLEELAAFGVTEDHLAACVAAGTVDAPLRRALAHLVAANRHLYRQAATSVPLLAPGARPCVQAALALYSGILTEIERDGYQVLARRAVVPTRRRLRIAGPLLARAAAGRLLAPRG